MFEAVDLYCERLGPDFWAEPVNAMTNLSFLLGAWFSWLKAKRRDLLSPAVWILLALTCAIGLGSMSFHTFAIGLTRLLDFLPILLFQLTYVWLYCREVMGLRMWTASASIFLYLVAVTLGRQFPEVLNGSLIYAPAIIVMLVLGTYHAVSNRNERFVVMVAAFTFLISLFARTIDEQICFYSPLGTHFLWHLLNGIVLYLLLGAYMVNQSSRVSSNNTMQHSIEDAS